MINVSNEFRKLMNTRTDFKENAEITFANGTVIELKEKDFSINNNKVNDASKSKGIPLGKCVTRNIKINIMNDDDRFSEYDFFGATIRLYLTFQLSETVEKIEYGIFTVLTPETYGTTVIITALDDMYKADKPYTTSLTFPATIGSMLRDACTTLGISQGTTTFLNDDFVVNEKPTDITYRQLFGYIAMIAAGNARIDVTGRLRIISYDFDSLEQITNVIDGGIYSPWNNPTDLDGGSFSPWNVGDVADGGTFTDVNSYHTLSNWSNLKVDTDDVVITGIQTTYTNSENEEHTAIYGTEGYVLSVENPLIVGQEEFAVGLIGNVMVGGRFRQFSGDLVANPTIEFMDIALILDRKGNMYFSFVTDINFQFFGFTSIKNSAEPTLRNSAKPYSEATKTLVKARKLINDERTAREQAVAQLANDLKNSSGLFMTEQKQSDGSTIYYMHDKPTLTESMIVWKLTALAFGISTDGGKTYPYGFTVNGEAIVKLLYAEGIDVENLVVGENVTMGPNAKISWSNVIGGQDAVTQITENTVTTEFINALGITAKSVAAEGITGETIAGKKYISNIYGSGTLGYRTEINSSNILSVGSRGNLEIDGATLKLSYGTKYTEIIQSGITSYNGINDYSEINGSVIKSYGGSSDVLQIDGATIDFTGTGQLKNTASVISIQSTKLSIESSYVYIGNPTNRLGFFGTTTANTKQTVSNLSSPSVATASTIASKLNDLLTALRSYGLIG